MTTRLSVVVPGLLGPPAELVDRARWLQFATQGLDIGVIEALLGRAEPLVDAFRDVSLEGIICRAMGVEAGIRGDWPIGRICYQHDGGSRIRGLCLRADPVYVRPGLAEVDLSTADAIGISDEEAQSLVGELNAHFDGEPDRLEAPHRLRWYIGCGNNELSGSSPPSMAAAGLLAELFPAGHAARPWRAWLNEAQMVLHASPVNAERLARGRLPVNSLWLWGAGDEVRINGRWSRMVSDHSLATALHAAADSAMRGEDAELRLESALYAPAVDQDIEAWRSALTDLLERLFEPLLKGLKAGEYSSIDVHPGFGAAYRATRKNQRTLWKRSQPLTSLLASED